MQVEVFDHTKQMAAAAAHAGAEALRTVIQRDGKAAVVFASAASQIEILDALLDAEGIDWSKVTAFHLDEYVGLPAEHPASFRKFLRDRVLARLPELAEFHFIEGDAPDVDTEARRVGKIIQGVSVAVGFIGIGENGHLAFNDPPADFDTDEPFLIVKLDEACRRQQIGEGWFPTLEDVPESAISMSIRRILKCRTLIITVPDARKAQAVRRAVEGAVGPMCPASILQNHADARLFLDEGSASLLGLCE
ncbi:MAG: glucosamine-6-phosphate deaminase [Rhodospirillales bacterium]|jgi:glucosamine-6-phosphate deaminase|nr:glucosamine-6-phosphate deaminase [Rhodospirillales bacterium]